MIGLFLLQSLKEQIQRTAVAFVLLAHLRIFHHEQHGFKILFLRWRFAHEVEHQGGVQSNLSLLPEGIIAGGVPWGSVLDEIVDELQHILLVPQIAKRVVAIRLAGVDQVKHLHIVALLNQQMAGGAQDLALGVRDEKRTVGAQHTRQAEKPCLTGAGATHHQNVQIAPVLVAVHADADAHGQDDISVRVAGVFILLTQCLGVAPLGAAIFLARSPVLTAGVVKANAHAVAAEGNRHEFQRVRRPADGKGALQQTAETPHQVENRHTVLIAGGKQRRQPQDRYHKCRPHRGGTAKAAIGLHTINSRSWAALPLSWHRRRSGCGKQPESTARYTGHPHQPH